MMKRPKNLPNWYCNFIIPPNLFSTFSPLIFLSGLDIKSNPTHHIFYETLTLKSPNKDFSPNYVNITLDHNFKEKKQKVGEHVESYVPRGILKVNWVGKHVEEVPSVVVVFSDMNWSETNRIDRKNDLATKIKSMKSLLAPHGTQILVMLMKPISLNEDNFTTERASAFCTAADIPAKNLFVLAHTSTERIQACIQRLEIGMRELSKIYYTNRIKRLKVLKEKVTVTPLLARYNFKIGFFQEIRKDFSSAINNYQSAYDAILSIKSTDASVQEVKVVSSILTYRICRIELASKSDGRESRNWFEKHINSFKKVEGNKELLFEHYAWLTQQYCQYADLLKEFSRGSALNIPDPVPYYMTAGNYAGRRREMFQKYLMESGGSMKWPGAMDPYMSGVEVKMSCLGQRPWWSNPFSQDYLFAEEEETSIQALKYFESLVNHSDEIISNCGTASDVCQKNKRVRTRCQLMGMMGSEFSKNGENGKSVMLMTHILRELASENWRELIYNVASIGIDAALRGVDPPSYYSFLLILLKTDLTDLLGKEKREKLWNELLMLKRGEVVLGSPEAEWTSYVEVHSESIITAQASFTSQNVNVYGEAQLEVVLLNRTDVELDVMKLGVRLSVSDYKCESNTKVTLIPNVPTLIKLSFKPLARDITKTIQIQVIYVDIGTQRHSVLLHYSLIKPFSTYLWPNGGKNVVTSIKIEPCTPLISISFTHNETLLSDEITELSLLLLNNSKTDYRNISVQLDSGLRLSDSVLNAKNRSEEEGGNSVQNAKNRSEEEGGNSVQNVKSEDMSYCFEIECLSGGDEERRVLWCRKEGGGGDVLLRARVKYGDEYGQEMVGEIVKTLHFKTPFLVSHTVEEVLAYEPFIISYSIVNNSGTKILLSKLQLMPPSVFKLKEDEKKTNFLLENGEEITALFLLEPTPFTGSISPGNLLLTWKKPGGDEEMSEFMSRALTIHNENSLHLSSSFSNGGIGKIKEGMEVTYTLSNRSPTTQDVAVSLDPSDVFMVGGPKRVSIKLYGGEVQTFTYTLFPLVGGFLQAPQLRVHTHPNGTQLIEPQSLSLSETKPPLLFINI